MSHTIMNATAAIIGPPAGGGTARVHQSGIVAANRNISAGYVKPKFMSQGYAMIVLVIVGTYMKI